MAVDSEGYKTGELTITYNEPVKFKANVSPNKGRESVDLFGIELNYDKVIVTDKMDCPIDEQTILWVDDLDTTHPHDYIVTRRAPSINSITYAIRKVDAGA
ncbi:hypothetical protein J6V85_03310 [Candidatus Saccharibacteria bacterium]|nr:hypothetical protein [Candidatus Saccharibacteria bacterium]